MASLFMCEKHFGCYVASIKTRQEWGVAGGKLIDNSGESWRLLRCLTNTTVLQARRKGTANYR